MNARLGRPICLRLCGVHLHRSVAGIALNIHGVVSKTGMVITAKRNCPWETFFRVDRHKAAEREVNTKFVRDSVASKFTAPKEQRCR